MRVIFPRQREEWILFNKSFLLSSPFFNSPSSIFWVFPFFNFFLVPFLSYPIIGKSKQPPTVNIRRRLLSHAPPARPHSTCVCVNHPPPFVHLSRTTTYNTSSYFRPSTTYHQVSVIQPSFPRSPVSCPPSITRLDLVSASYRILSSTAIEILPC